MSEDRQQSEGQEGSAAAAGQVRLFCAMRLHSLHRDCHTCLLHMPVLLCHRILQSRLQTRRRQPLSHFSAAGWRRLWCVAPAATPRPSLKSSCALSQPGYLFHMPCLLTSLPADSLVYSEHNTLEQLRCLCSQGPVAACRQRG